MTLPALNLSLQFARLDAMRPLRAAMPRAQVARWIRHALASDAQVVHADIAVRVVEADEGLRLNERYRSKPYATNVLTFDYSGAPVVSADLVLCAAVVQAEAAELGKPLAAHCAHLVVHGTLHALGHDHETGDAEADAMEALETAVLAKLGFDDPYAARDAQPNHAA